MISIYESWDLLYVSNVVWFGKIQHGKIQFNHSSHDTKHTFLILCFRPPFLAFSAFLKTSDGANLRVTWFCCVICLAVCQKQRFGNWSWYEKFLFGVGNALGLILLNDWQTNILSRSFYQRNFRTVLEIDIPRLNWGNIQYI